MASWENDVLRQLGAPVTAENLKFLRSWQAHEGGWTHNDATYNPLNTTRGPGKSINRVGVKAFPDYDTGMQMTVETILNGRYPNIVQGLRAGNPYNFDVRGDLSTWVSGSPTAGLKYAGRVLGGKGVSRRSPPVQVGPRNTVALDTQERSGRKAAANAFLGIALDYSRTGKVNPTRMLQAARIVSPKGNLTPPSYDQAKAKQRTPTASGVVDNVLAAAHEQVGKPYVFGSGPDTSSFDCSDLIQWAYSQVGIEIPRTTWEQIKAGTPVKWGEIQPGDLVFSHKGGHVVMYVGGGKVIAAPYTGTNVQYQPLSRFKNSFVTARRVIQ